MCSFVLLLALGALGSGERRVPQHSAASQDAATITAPQVTAAIDKFATIEYSVRSDAARTVRRASADLAVPLLVNAAADSRKDGFIRFRSLILLSGFKDPRTRDVMVQALSSPSDRLRAVAYSFFEHQRDPQILPRLLDGLGREESEFVRPALTRALAAHGDDPRVREALAGLVMKGQDFFRSAVIEAVGDYKGAYALPSLVEVAKLDGPLQDDAVIAIGKIGDKRALDTLAALQRTAPRSVQPSIAAAICLLGVNCSSHQGYLERTLRFAIANAGYQPLLRAAASGLGALAIAGHESAVSVLVADGVPTRDPARAAIALAIGAVALRNTPIMLKVLEQQPDPKPALELLRESFDMLEEDLDEERFFVTVRRGYWQAADKSPARTIAAALIRTLEF